VVSINLPISEQVVGSRATRTTHPLVLERFREFFSALLGSSIGSAIRSSGRPRRTWSVPSSNLVAVR
jgi:hypothetical protein